MLGGNREAFTVPNVSMPGSRLARRLRKRPPELKFRCLVS
jgi:hypothetical protein